MKLLCGVSVQANGIKSTAPRYLTSAVSETGLFLHAMALEYFLTRRAQFCAVLL